MTLTCLSLKSQTDVIQKVKKHLFLLQKKVKETVKISRSGLLINSCIHTNTNARNRCPNVAHAAAKNLEHIHAVSFQWHPQKVPFRNADTSAQNETNSREGLTLKWDTTLDSSPGVSPLGPGPGHCVQPSHHGNWAGMSQSFR